MSKGAYFVIGTPADNNDCDGVLERESFGSWGKYGAIHGIGNHIDKLRLDMRAKNCVVFARDMNALGYRVQAIYLTCETHIACCTSAKVNESSLLVRMLLTSENPNKE
jgi:hypothetical protein